MFAQDLDSRFVALREAVRLIPTTPPSEERARVLASLAEALSLAVKMSKQVSSARKRSHSPARSAPA